MVVVEEYIEFKPRHPLDIIKEQWEEIKFNRSDDFTCLTLEENPYDWQFAIRGLNGTEFEGGIYHGRIQFPEGYPRRRPKFKLLTENGCFETQSDISCFLFRPESFTVRDALHRLIELLPTYQYGALGSVGYDKEERRDLARKSREAPPTYGTAQRQELINMIHGCMLCKASPGDIQIEQNQMLLPATTVAMDIAEELKEMQSNPSDDFKCFALAGNVYDWQLAIRGPNGTEFEGGIYHARIQFPEEYPRKCPTFKLLTENGRFKTHTEICFPWYPLNVRDTLHGLIELLPTYPDGDALDSVGYDKEKRHALAIKSREAPPKYGTDQRQKLINLIHEDMLRKVPPPPPLNGGGDICESSQNDSDKRNVYFISRNTITANNSSQVGISDFENVRTTKSDDLRCSVS